jgi:hypothetical protein
MVPNYGFLKKGKHQNVFLDQSLLPMLDQSLSHQIPTLGLRLVGDVQLSNFPAAKIASLFPGMTGLPESCIFSFFAPFQASGNGAWDSLLLFSVAFVFLCAF